jgi:hypothetical protein
MSEIDSKPTPDHLDNGPTGVGKHQTDAEFGGTEARRLLEKRLLRKLDLRMGILVFIYILNYVSIACFDGAPTLSYLDHPDRQKQCGSRPPARFRGGPRPDRTTVPYLVIYTLRRVHPNADSEQYVLELYVPRRFILPTTQLIHISIPDIGKPSIYLPACMLVWGMISVLTGITQKWVLLD